MREMRDAFFEPLVEEALKDKNVIILAADHTAMSLEKMIAETPDQFINVGISEQNMVSVSAGMALRGKRVFAYGITPFVSLKVLEQLTMDVAIHNLNVNIISVGAGFSYSTDGPSHHGLQDVGCVLSVPNLTVWNCSDPIISQEMALRAVNEPGPTYIRIEKGMMAELSREQDRGFGCSQLRSGSDVCIVTSGAMVHDVLSAADQIDKEIGLSCQVLDLYQLKPLPRETLCDLLKNFSRIVTVEETYLSSGFSNSISSVLLEKGLHPRLLRIGVSDQFCYEYGSRSLVKSRFGLSSADIAKKIGLWLQQR